MKISKKFYGFTLGATARHINQNLSNHGNTSLRGSKTTEAIHTSRNKTDCHTPLRSVRNDVKRAAFTLAEVLTTLVIIGIIAAITAPILQATISEHILDKQMSVFERKFDQNMHVMQLKGELAKPYATTMDFAKTMQKYMNITKICDKEHLTECFAPAIMQDKRTVKYDVATLRTAADVSIVFSDQYDPDLVGIVFADGITAIISQDSKCVVSDRYNQTADVSYCLGMYYDVNGLEGPNILKKDILSMNVGSKSIDIGDIYTSEDFGFYTVAQCDAAKKAGAPINDCTQSKDYWAAAVDFCHQKGKHLPTTVDLQRIAGMLYGETIPLTGEKGGLTIKDEDLWKKFGQPYTAGVSFWSSEEHNADSSYYRSFSSSSTDGNWHYRPNSAIKAFCLGDEE